MCNATNKGPSGTRVRPTFDKLKRKSTRCCVLHFGTTYTYKQNTITEICMYFCILSVPFFKSIHQGHK